MRFARKGDADERLRHIHQDTPRRRHRWPAHGAGGPARCGAAKRAPVDPAGPASRRRSGTPWRPAGAGRAFEGAGMMRAAAAQWTKAAAETLPVMRPENIEGDHRMTQDISDEAVERFSASASYTGIMKPSRDGLWVQYHDYAALVARLKEVEEWNRQMVIKAASGGALEGYRELGAKLAHTEAKLEIAREALHQLHHAVCGETGLIACVRKDTGKAYPWPAYGIAEAKAVEALALIDQPEKE